MCGLMEFHIWFFILPCDIACHVVSGTFHCALLREWRWKRQIACWYTYKKSFDLTDFDLQELLDHILRTAALEIRLSLAYLQSMLLDLFAIFATKS